MNERMNECLAVWDLNGIGAYILTGYASIDGSTSLNVLCKIFLCIDDGM